MELTSASADMLPLRGDAGRPFCVPVSTAVAREVDKLCPSFPSPDGAAGAAPEHVHGGRGEADEEDVAEDGHPGQGATRVNGHMHCHSISAWALHIPELACLFIYKGQGKPWQLLEEYTAECVIIELLMIMENDQR